MGIQLEELSTIISISLSCKSKTSMHSFLHSIRVIPVYKIFWLRTNRFWTGNWQTTFFTTSSTF